jgi:hypothetical protein
MSSPEPRADSACDACGVVDDLPRHHVVVFDQNAPPDGLRVDSRHFECCLDLGCPDQSCIAALAAYKARVVA